MAQSLRPPVSSVSFLSQAAGLQPSLEQQEVVVLTWAGAGRGPGTESSSAVGRVERKGSHGDFWAPGEARDVPTPANTRLSCKSAGAYSHSFGGDSEGQNTSAFESTLCSRTLAPSPEEIIWNG